MPEKMSLIRILAPIDFVEEISIALLESGVFHITSKPGRGSLAERFRREFVLVEEYISRMDQYLSVIGARVSRDSREKIQFKIDSVYEALSVSRERMKIIDLEFGELVERYREYESKISEYQSIVYYLEYLKDLDIDLEGLVRGFSTRLKVLILSSDRLSEFSEELSHRLDSYYFIYRLSRDEREVVGVLLYSADRESLVGELLRMFRVRVFELKEEFPKNFSKAYEKAYRELEHMKSFIEDIRARARERYNKIGEIFNRAYQELYLLRDILRILSHAQYTSSFFVLEGFVPHRSKRLVLDKLLSESGEKVLIEIHDISRLEKLDEEPPTSYRIPDLLRPFRLIPDLYGTPSYSEIIPVFLTAITFPIIFGLMFPDIGHGIAIMLGGFLLMKFFRDQGGRDLGQLLVYLGLASIATGFLSGEFFGPATPVSHYLERLYEDLHIKPPLQLPIYKPEAGVAEALYSFILLSVRIAVITLFVSSLLGVLNSVINRELDYLFALALPRMLVFTSIAIPALSSNDIASVGAYYSYISLGQLLSLLGMGSNYVVPAYIEIVKWLLNISLIWIILGESIVESITHDVRHGISKIGAGFIEMFDTLIMAVGNSMSYLRIMGIALAHIAVVVSFYVPAISLFESTSIVDKISAWAMYSVGNLLAMTLEAIIAFAHTLRLHLYEMFSKFYRGLGRPYQPLIPIAYRIEIV
ncbi:MAG: V-type ATPase 116kDa subunit family protein [Sulfolobales archaeon]